MHVHVFVVAGLVLAGCASQRTETILSRFDGQPIAPVERERVVVECNSAGVQAATAVPVQGYGLAGAIATGSARDAAVRSAQEGCLARNGIKATIVAIPDKPV